MIFTIDTVFIILIHFIFNLLLQNLDLKHTLIHRQVKTFYQNSNYLKMHLELFHTPLVPYQ